MAKTIILSLILFTFSANWSADDSRNISIGRFNLEIKKISQNNKNISWKISEYLADTDFTKKISDKAERNYRQNFFSCLTAAQDSILNTKNYIAQGDNLLSQYEESSNANELPAHLDLTKSRMDALKKWNNDLSDLYLGVLQRQDIKNILVPDSIDLTRSWNLIENKQTISSFDGSLLIRRKESFTPASILDPSKKILFIVTHGTFGKLTPSFIDEFEPKKQNFRHIKRFASWYADKHQTNLDLVSFKWTGELFDTPRFNAAGALDNYIKQNYPNIPLVLLAHSHGCNIHNKFSQLTKNPINLMIHLACPKRCLVEEPYYQPKNFKQLVYFHTMNDAIEPYGRLTKGLVFESFGIAGISLASIFALQLLNNYTNTYDVAINYEELKKRILIGFGIKVGQAISTGTLGYGYGRITSTVKRKMNEDNFFYPEIGSTIIGFDTYINTENLGHSTIIDVVKYLPDIMQKIENEHLDTRELVTVKTTLHIQDPETKNYNGLDGKINVHLSNIEVVTLISILNMLRTGNSKNYTLINKNT